MISAHHLLNIRVMLRAGVSSPIKCHKITAIISIVKMKKKKTCGERFLSLDWPLLKIFWDFIFDVWYHQEAKVFVEVKGSGDWIAIDDVQYLISNWPWQTLPEHLKSEFEKEKKKTILDNTLIISKRGYYSRWGSTVILKL